MEILGLLDTLESLILEGTRIPFSKKVVIDEEKVLAVLDKIRLVVQGGGGFAKEVISGKGAQKVEVPQTQAEEPQEGGAAVDVLQQAYQMAKEIREGADKYADEVLENLEATTTRILRTLKAGRDRLSKTTKVEQG